MNDSLRSFNISIKEIHTINIKVLNSSLILLISKKLINRIQLDILQQKYLLQKIHVLS